MSGCLHLVITTPSTVLADASDVVSVRAEDKTGGFGILPGHADFLTVLPASIIRWRDGGNHVHFCAVSGGVITVAGGRFVSVACRQGALGDDLVRLESDIQHMRLESAEADRRTRIEQTRLHANAVRQLMKYLRPDRDGIVAPSGGKEGAP